LRAISRKTPVNSFDISDSEPRSRRFAKTPDNRRGRCPQLFDKVEIDDCRAVNSAKHIRVELQFQTSDRFAARIGHLADVQANVVSFRLDPTDVFDFDEEYSPVLANRKLFYVLCLAFEPVNELSKLFFSSSFRAASRRDFALLTVMSKRSASKGLSR
jgi:hypothetical protein